MIRKQKVESIGVLAGLALTNMIPLSTPGQFGIFTTIARFVLLFVYFLFVCIYNSHQRTVLYLPIAGPTTRVYQMPITTRCVLVFKRFFTAWTKLLKYSWMNHGRKLLWHIIVAQEEGGVECLRAVEDIPLGVEVTISYRWMILIRVTSDAIITKST